MTDDGVPLYQLSFAPAFAEVKRIDIAMDASVKHTHGFIASID
jgi:hypothetical protein